MRYAVDSRIEGGLAYGGGETEGRGVFGNSWGAPWSSRAIRINSHGGSEFGGKSQGGRRDRRADCRGNAAFGAGGDAGLGRERGRSDGERNSATTCDASPREKKLRWDTQFCAIGVLEPQYRCETKRIRPFLRSAKVVPRGCSRPLQRVITDFAADQPFALARLKLLEHYGFEIGESTIQRVTLGHAQALFETGRPSEDFPQTPGLHKEIIAQTDGGMIPIVEPDAGQKDKRLSWREAKLCLAHAKGSQTPVYAGTIEGGVETAGRQLFACAVRAGFGANSKD